MARTVVNVTASSTLDGRDISADGTKLDGIEASADVTDATNVTAAGALMDSEVTNLAQVKAFSSSDYATAAQGTKADSALQNVVEDTTPQLGGNLDFNGNLATTFTSTGIDDNATSTAITIDSSERTSFTSASNRPISAVSTDTNAFVTFQDTNSASLGHVKIGSETDDMVFYANAQERMRIKGGNVGIGTTDPDSNLHIEGSTAANLRLERNDTTIGNGNAIGNIHFEHQETGYAGICATFGVRAGNNNGNGEFVFLNGVAGTVTEKMRIDRNGNVGIGSASNHAGARVVINDTPPTAFGSPMLQVGQETFTASGYYSIGLGFTDGTYTEPPAEIAAVSTSSSGGTTAAIIFGTRSVTTNTAVTERMRIRANGQLLLGGTVNSPVNVRMVVFGTGNATGVYNTGHTGIHINNNAATAGLGNYGAGLSFGRFGGSSDDNSAMIVPVQTTADADHMGISFFTHNTNTRGNPLGEVMRINSTGQLTVAGATNGFDTTPAVNGLQAHYETDAGEATLGSYSSGGSTFMTFHTNSGGSASSEAMRLDSSGNLLVGCTSFGSVSTEGCQLGNAGTAIFSNDSDIPLYLNRTTSGVTASQVVVSFFRNDVQSGTIGVSQGGTPAFGAPSDIRLKENVADHKSELTNVMALRPVSWDWKDSSKGAGEGFVAQELEQTAWSDLVSDGEDGYKMVSGLGAVETRLIKALQEAVTRIETLEAEVTALKGE